MHDLCHHLDMPPGCGLVPSRHGEHHFWHVNLTFYVPADLSSPTKKNRVWGEFLDFLLECGALDDIVADYDRTESCGIFIGHVMDLMGQLRWKEYESLHFHWYCPRYLRTSGMAERDIFTRCMRTGVWPARGLGPDPCKAFFRARHGPMELYLALCRLFVQFDLCEDLTDELQDVGTSPPTMRGGISQVDGTRSGLEPRRSRGSVATTGVGSVLVSSPRAA